MTGSKRRASRVAAITTAGLVGLAALGFAGLRGYSQASLDPAFFDDDVASLAAEPTAEGSIVFVGSSSLRFWETLERDMAPLPVVNRGFGGAQMVHVARAAKALVVPVRPRAVVVYAGDNDLDAGTGKNAETVLTDYQTFVSIVHAAVPEAIVYFLTIKPSVLRWDRWPEMSRANARIAAWSEGDDRLRVIDMGPATIGADGLPRADRFRFDGLHLNEEGYAAWTSIVRPRLMNEMGVEIDAHLGEASADDH